MPAFERPTCPAAGAFDIGDHSVFRLFRILQFTTARPAGRALIADACLHSKPPGRVADAIRPSAHVPQTALTSA
jgi:hypothetical protein